MTTGGACRTENVSAMRDGSERRAASVLQATLVPYVKLCVIVMSNAVRKGLARRMETVHVGMGSVEQTAAAAQEGTLVLIAKSDVSLALVQSRAAAWETVIAVAMNMRLGHHVKSVAEDTLVTIATLGVMHPIRVTVEEGALPQEHVSVIQDGQARPVMNAWRARWDTPLWRARWDTPL